MYNSTYIATAIPIYILSFFSLTNQPFGPLNLLLRGAEQRSCSHVKKTPSQALTMTQGSFRWGNHHAHTNNGDVNACTISFSIDPTPDPGGLVSWPSSSAGVQAQFKANCIQMLAACISIYTFRYLFSVTYFYNEILLLVRQGLMIDFTLNLKGTECYNLNPNRFNTVHAL